MLARIKQATEELEELIEKETGGKYTLCSHPRVQFYANHEHKHTLKELESFVGPVELRHVSDDELLKHYDFTLNAVPCVIVLPDNIMDDGSTH
jgi:hypothetical protein